MSLFARLAQNALHHVVDTAEVLETGLKKVFQEGGLPTPEKTRGELFVRTVRTYATRLDKHLAQPSTRPQK